MVQIIHRPRVPKSWHRYNKHRCQPALMYCSRAFGGKAPPDDPREAPPIQSCSKLLRRRYAGRRNRIRLDSANECPTRLHTINRSRPKYSASLILAATGGLVLSTKRLRTRSRQRSRRHFEINVISPTARPQNVGPERWDPANGMDLDERITMCAFH